MNVPGKVQIGLHLPPAALSASGIRIVGYCLPLSRSTSSPVLHFLCSGFCFHFFFMSFVYRFRYFDYSIFEQTL